MQLRRTPPLTAAERYVLALLAAPHPARPAGADDRFWEEVLGLAFAHRLGEFLHARRGEAVRADWPPAARGALREWYVETALRNARFRAELARVAAALRARGIAPVLLKGGALTLTVYGDLAERPYGDIDLLIHRDELEAAAAVMAELGFRLDESWQPRSFYLAHHYHLIFRHAQRPWLCFELHWDLSLQSMDASFDAAGLRARAVSVALADTGILVPAPADELLHLALHAGVNGFGYLGQIRDVATLAEAPPAQLDPAAVWRRAREGSLATPLAACLRLARLFGGGGPDRLLAARPPGRHSLLERLLRPETVLRQRILRSAAGVEAAAFLRRDGWPGRLACLRRMVHPGEGDLGMNGHPTGAPTGPTLWAAAHYGPVSPLRAGIWTLLALGGWDVQSGREARSAPNGDAGRS